MISMWIELHAVTVKPTDDLRTALLFPFAMLMSFGVHHSTWLVMTVAVLQFPIYGIVIGWAWLQDKPRRIAVGLSLIHLIATLTCEVVVLIRYYS